MPAAAIVPVPPGRPGGRRQVLLLAWPIGVSMVSFTLKGFVDTLMVGSLGTGSLAAVGMAGMVAFNTVAFPMGVLRGQKSLVSQYLGAGDRDAARSFGAQAFHLALLFGVLCLLLARLAGPILGTLLGDSAMSPAAVAQATAYLRMRLLWALPYLCALSLAEYHRGCGRTRLPMAADLLAHPLNVLFNWLLIFGHAGFPALGVRGAALGTGLADTISLLLLLRFGAAAPRPPLRSLLPRLRRFLRVLDVGASSGVQFTIEVGSFTTITWLISTHLGDLSTAAHQAALQILHVSFMPAIAVGDAAGVLIGRYVGERRLDVVRRSFRSMLQINIPLMVAMGGLFLLFGGRLMGLFLKPPDPEQHEAAIRLGSAVLAAGAAWQLGDAFQIAGRFALRAAGDHRWVMWVGILMSWGLSVPLALVVLRLLHGDVVAVWWAWNAEIYLGSVVFWLRWRSGAWIRKRLVQEGDAGPGSDGGVSPAAPGRGAPPPRARRNRRPRRAC